MITIPAKMIKHQLPRVAPCLPSAISRAGTQPLVNSYPQAASFFRDYPVCLVGVLISCATAEAGEQFVEHFDVADVVTHIDVNGKLSTGVLGVSLSPAAVAIDAANVVRSAVAFASYSALANWMDSVFDPDSALEADAVPN
jgi:hypothetical protein